MTLRWTTLVAVAGLVLLLLVAWPPAARADDSVALEPGWNNVSYPGETLPVTRALADSGGVVTSVWHWQADRATWSSWFAAAPGIATLEALETGEAYWLFASRGVVWSPPAEVLFQTASLELTTAAGASLVLRAELADTAARRTRGLMFRPSLGEEEGMLFLFPRDTTGGFWMQDTLVPLSIAFIDWDGRIMEILDMEPLTTAVHRPAQPYRWAVEVNQGWYEARGVAAGDIVRLRGS